MNKQQISKLISELDDEAFDRIASSLLPSYLAGECPKIFPDNLEEFHDKNKIAYLQTNCIQYLNQNGAFIKELKSELNRATSELNNAINKDSKR